MKKTISFNLEEDIIERIESYQKECNLSSRSAALERIILAMNNANVDTDRIIKLLNNIKESIDNKEFNKKEIVKEEINNEIVQSIENCFDEMPD
ncbi:hypothetical protein [Clostridium tetani]|uniref:Ribbon-helix-helix protein CopG domain-containing protein n=1 Tax=Clostridium tetani TaxID=1513 RepID=A0ABY0ET56_CLOTA|nr:hypothetical protein [Clostridium tetani]RXI58954.1 hypothetical protein DP131_00340 [Clostridium tetani]